LPSVRRSRAFFSFHITRNEGLFHSKYYVARMTAFSLQCPIPILWLGMRFRIFFLQPVDLMIIALKHNTKEERRRSSSRKRWLHSPVWLYVLYRHFFISVIITIMINRSTIRLNSFSIHHFVTMVPIDHCHLSTDESTCMVSNTAISQFFNIMILILMSTFLLQAIRLSLVFWLWKGPTKTKSLLVTIGFIYYTYIMIY